VDGRGKLVAVLVDEFKHAGDHEAVLPGNLGSGMYIIRLTAGAKKLAAIHTKLWHGNFPFSPDHPESVTDRFDLSETRDDSPCAAGWRNTWLGLAMCTAKLYKQVFSFTGLDILEWVWILSGSLEQRYRTAVLPACKANKGIFPLKW
jgi:hypothetical protein